jgi:hypothetical protein
MGISETRADGSGDFEGQFPVGHTPTTRVLGAGRQKTEGRRQKQKITCYQIRTRFPGSTYNLSPGFTSNAS